jgi:hypothetical protein
LGCSFDTCDLFWTKAPKSVSDFWSSFYNKDVQFQISLDKHQISTHKLNQCLVEPTTFNKLLRPAHQKRFSFISIWLDSS